MRESTPTTSTVIPSTPVASLRLPEGRLAVVAIQLQSFLSCCRSILEVASLQQHQGLDIAERLLSTALQQASMNSFWTLDHSALILGAPSGSVGVQD